MMLTDLGRSVNYIPLHTRRFKLSVALSNIMVEHFPMYLSSKLSRSLYECGALKVK
jgi:hypothetical protein